MTNMPPLNFSKWMSWGKRFEFADRKEPGVYMISITENDLEGKEPRYEDVVYIGMTTSQGGLLHRWKQFDNSITKGEYLKGNGNSGGDSAFKDLGNYKDWQLRNLRLYVCGYALACNTKKTERASDDLIKMGIIRYLEYKALSECKSVTGSEPKYNTQ